jgi:hypothetical protein
MCGLSGVISRYLSDVEVDLFRELAVVSTIRGADGSGFISVPSKAKHKIQIYRSPKPAAASAYDDEFDNLYRQKTAVMMSHARYPTKGKPGVEGLHPHVVDHVIGMHNGTVDEVCGVRCGPDTFDSKVLFGHIADLGVDEAIKNTRGAYALTWVDTKAGTLNFLRNAKRTLYFAHGEGDPHTLYWSSELEMLELVLERAYGIIKIMVLPTDTLVTLNLRNKMELTTTMRRVVQSWEMLQDPNAKTTTVPNVPRSSVPLLPAPPINGSPTTAVKDQNAVGDDTMMPVNGFQMKYKDVKTMLAHGCTNCREAATVSDLALKRLHFTGPREFACHACCENDADVATIAANWQFSGGGAGVSEVMH